MVGFIALPLEAYHHKTYRKLSKYALINDMPRDPLVIVNGDLRGADLSHMNLSGIKFINCNFENAILHFTFFVRASLLGSNFVNAQFWMTDFREADLRFADFRASLIETGRNDSLAFENSASFHGADLRGANFTGTNLAGILFDEDTKMAGAIFAQFNREAYRYIPKAILVRKNIILTRRDFIKAVRSSEYIDILEY